MLIDSYNFIASFTVLHIEKRNEKVLQEMQHLVFNA